MKNLDAIARYEQFVLGNRPFYTNGDKEQKKEDALAVIRYVIEEVLHWSPSDAMNHLTDEIAKDTGIDSCLRYLPFPKDIDEEDYLRYAVWMCYPRRTQYNHNVQILRLYRKIQNGELSRFPKRVFDGENGPEKAAILLNDYIAHKISYNSIPELYEKFSDTSKMNLLFKEDQIYYAYKTMYATPLDYLHHSLPIEDRDDFLYGYYQYMAVTKELSRSMLLKIRKENS